MSKRAWVRPLAVGQRFTPNEYIAACGDSGKTYNFECNAGQSGHYYYIYQSKDRLGVPNYSTINGHYFGPLGNKFTPCNQTHTADSDSGFLTGYYLDEMLSGRIEQIPVIIWTDNGRNVHCTTNLDINSWTLAKS